MASSTKQKARRRMGRRRREPDTSVYSGRVAARLRMLRDKKGKTPEEMRDRLAELGLDVHLATYYSWENGQNKIDLDYCPFFAKALGVSLSHFMPSE